jgi:nitroimidazol reductase NimA-like FMN-containing flavoprotein (pyridoxamine 5'-phosphate oxidase superfamily)
MTPLNAPVFRELDREECEALLARNHVGRIAFSYHDHVDIEPIHFVYEDGWIYGRTADGTKLRALAHNRWVAFETDEISATFVWQSVVTKGALYLLESDGVRGEAYDHAVEVLQSFIPEALTENDPVPSRTVVFRIHADQVTGRAATTQPRAGQ